MALIQTNQEDVKFQNVSLPKTAATVNNKTEHFLPTSNQNINTVDTFTQKDIRSYNLGAEAGYDRKVLSKQLLSQIHFCRFLYKLIARMGEKLSEDLNLELTSLKEFMTGLIF